MLQTIISTKPSKREAFSLVNYGNLYNVTPGIALYLTADASGLNFLHFHFYRGLFLSDLFDLLKRILSYFHQYDAISEKVSCPVYKFHLMNIIVKSFITVTIAFHNMTVITFRVSGLWKRTTPASNLLHALL